MCGEHFYGNQYKIADTVKEMNSTTLKKLSSIYKLIKCLISLMCG